MNETVIKVEGLSKQYRLGKIGTGSLAHDVNRWWHMIRGKEDPYLKISEANNREVKNTSDYVWSLKDINFSITRGDVVGIIGRNGAGKSTLLKILSRTTTPTLGKAFIKGRVASLLEIGTGFHPELSGRENIFLNGAILGMRKKEIKLKFDEIVDFSGVEKYIDTPVKRYSSGMYVRLAFAVAAYLESEILVVDEVLAVGDGEFQKKCLGKLKDVSTGEGRTVLFVSHNMASIRTLCNKGILMLNGTVTKQGDIDEIIQGYHQQFITNDLLKSASAYEQNLERDAQFISARLEHNKHDGALEFDVFDHLWLNFSFVVRKKLTGTTPILCFKKDGVDLCWSFASDQDDHLLEGIPPGKYNYRVKLPYPLKKGIYSCSLRLGKLRVKDYDHVEDAVVFSVDDISFDPTNKSYASKRPGIIPGLLNWEIDENS